MINVIGLGYIGLPTALMMASHGVEVIGTDYNKELVTTLNAGKTTFKEGGLDELFAAAVKAGIKFTTEYQKDGYVYRVGAYSLRQVLEEGGCLLRGGGCKGSYEGLSERSNCCD